MTFKQICLCQCLTQRGAMQGSSAVESSARGMFVRPPRHLRAQYAARDTDRGMPFAHQTVNHSAGEYVDGDCHTNGIESFWAILKRAHKGTYHKMSPKHLARYARGFAGKNNCRGMPALARMRHAAARLVGRRLSYRALIAPNGLPSGARSPI